MDEIQCLQLKIEELMRTPGVYWLSSDSIHWVNPELFAWLRKKQVPIVADIRASRSKKAAIFINLSSLTTTVDPSLVEESVNLAQAGTSVFLYGPRRWEPKEGIQHTDPFAPLLSWTKGLVDRALHPAREPNGDVSWIPSDALPDGLLDYIDSKVLRIRELDPYTLSREMVLHRGDPLLFLDISDVDPTVNDSKRLLQVIRLLNERGCVYLDGNRQVIDPKPKVVCLAPYNWPYTVCE